MTGVTATGVGGWKARRIRLTGRLAALSLALLALLAAAAGLWFTLAPTTLSRVDFALPGGTPARAEVVGHGLEGLGRVLGDRLNIYVTGDRGAGDREAGGRGAGARAAGAPAAPCRWELAFSGLEDKCPWKVAAGDFDGDGAQDLLVGVWKTTPLDGNPAPRPFVYNLGLDAGRLTVTPKWLGSRLPGPFCDLAAGDVDADGRAELVALMMAPDGLVYVASLGWSGFGFEGEAASLPFTPPQPVSPERPGRAGLRAGEGGVALPDVGTFVYRPVAPGPPGGPWPATLEGPQPGSR